MADFVMLSAKAVCDIVERDVWKGKNAESAYFWGAMGERVTESMVQEWIRRVGGPETSQGKTILKYKDKWMGKYAWDCSGIYRWLTKKHITPYQSGGATTMFGKAMRSTGRIASMPDTRGIWVFRAKKLADGSYSDTQMAHVGLYMGDGTVIHAKGTAYGVIREKLSAATWTHWGAAARMIYEIEIDGGMHLPPTEEEGGKDMIFQAKVKTTATGGKLNVRSGPGSNNKKIGELKDGTVVNVIAVDASGGWYEINSVDGKSRSWVSASFAIKIATSEPAPPANVGTGVFIPAASSAAAKTIADALKQVVVTAT